MKDYEDDGMWMWVAFVASCRLIIDFVIGPRKQYVADKLVELVNKCLSEKIPVFITDGLAFYKGALLSVYGVVEEFPRTGKRGRPKKPKLVPSNDLILTSAFLGAYMLFRKFMRSEDCGLEILPCI